MRFAPEKISELEVNANDIRRLPVDIDNLNVGVILANPFLFLDYFHSLQRYIPLHLLTVDGMAIKLCENPIFHKFHLSKSKRRNS